MHAYTASKPPSVRHGNLKCMNTTDPLLPIELHSGIVTAY
jgi:hypothetical protein